MYDQLKKQNIESEIFNINDKVKQLMEKNEIKKLEETMAVIKKIIKDNIEAKYKFYSLLILKEIMKKEQTNIATYFLKKLSDRLVKIANYKSKKKESEREKGETCLYR
jgi:hypothetical protein